MYKKSVDQHLIVLNLCSVSSNKLLATEFITVKNLKKNNLAGTHFQKVKSNTRMNRKHSKTNRLLKTIECIAND